MEIHAKISTEPLSTIKIAWKRNPPKIGDYINFKRIPVQRYAKWESGIIDTIKDVGFPLYLIERM